MPEYAWKCDKCEHITEVVRKMSDCDEATACEECNSANTYRYYGEYTRAAQFKPFWCEHLDREPVYIESKKHFKEECDKRGMVSHWLGNEAKEIEGRA